MSRFGKMVIRAVAISSILALLVSCGIASSFSEFDSKNKTIKVMAGCNLEYVRIGENTEGVKAEDLSVGDVITVEYDFLFEKYDPVYVSYS